MEATLKIYSPMNKTVVEKQGKQGIEGKGGDQ